MVLADKEEYSQILIPRLKVHDNIHKTIAERPCPSPPSPARAGDVAHDIKGPQIYACANAHAIKQPTQLLPIQSGAALLAAVAHAAPE